MGVTSLGRHTRPACHPGSSRDVLIKKVDVDLHRVCFSWLLGCEGSGTTFHGLRMRSRSTRKCAHRNVGDLGSSLVVCACVYDPIHVTAQGKSFRPNCACVLSARHYRGLPINAYVCFPMGSREFPWPYMASLTSIWSHGLYAWFWLVEPKFAALWLVTTWSSHYYYSPLYKLYIYIYIYIYADIYIYMYADISDVCKYIWSRSSDIAWLPQGIAYYSVFHISRNTHCLSPIMHKHCLLFLLDDCNTQEK